MGNYFASNMESNLKKNQDFITEMNTIKMERQLQMRKQMRDREIALEIAKNRELFLWTGAFYLATLTWAFIGYKYKRKMIIFSPLIPLTVLVAYQADLAYGNKQHRILMEAEHIMKSERELLSIPQGIPTVASIDLDRFKNDEQKKLHPLQP